MIKLIKSTFFKESETKKKLAAFILKTPILSMGREVLKFEKAFAKKQGRKFAVMVNSGSSANLILLQALLNRGIIKKDDGVGFSAVTWATNVMPIIQLGLKALPVDCEINTLNVSPRTLKPHLQNLKCLFLTNALGFSDDIASIKKMCAANNIILLEDNCESLGSKHSGKLLGNFGLASTFSFYVGHHLSTVEGGMVATDDERLYEMLIMTRAHGWDRNLTFESATILKKVHGIDGFFSRYTFYDLAYNVRPTEIQGYLGNLQLRYWKKIVEVRRKNFLRLDKISRLNPDLLPVKHEQMDLISNFAFPLIFKSKELFNLYKTKFERAGVEIRPIISGNMTAQPVFKKYVGLTRCPNAEFVHENGFYFGNNPDMTKSELETLGKLLEKN